MARRPKSARASRSSRTGPSSQGEHASEDHGPTGVGGEGQGLPDGRDNLGACQTRLSRGEERS